MLRWHLCIGVWYQSATGRSTPLRLNSTSYSMKPVNRSSLVPPKGKRSNKRRWEMRVSSKPQLVMNIHSPWGTPKWEFKSLVGQITTQTTDKLQTESIYRSSISSIQNIWHRYPHWVIGVKSSKTVKIYHITYLEFLLISKRSIHKYLQALWETKETI